MKNRRLNVLFIAIIALAAAPQAWQDAHRLVNAAQERAETEFWSVFLSYRTPAAGDAEAVSASGLVASNRHEAQGDCPLERGKQSEAVRDSRKNESSTPTRVIRESRRASAKSDQDAPQAVEADLDEETIASMERVSTAAFAEKDKNALRAAGLHARDVEKIASLASRATLASFVQGNEDRQIKVKQLMEMDKFLRQRARYDRPEPGDEIPAPNPVGSM
jgi:hypothetical protein